MTQYLIVFFISMVPLIELRGAIPYAVGFHLPLLPSYVIAIIGNMIPVPIIYLFARRVLIWGKDKPVIGKFFTFCLEKGEKGGKKLQAKAGRGLFLALMLFVGIPLPGTGAWTGTAGSQPSGYGLQVQCHRSTARRTPGRYHHGGCQAQDCSGQSARCSRKHISHPVEITYSNSIK